MGMYVGRNYYERQHGDGGWIGPRSNDPDLMGQLQTALDAYEKLLNSRRWAIAPSIMAAMASRGLDFGSSTIRADPWPWVAQQSVKAADTLIAELMKAESDTRCSVQTTNRG